MKQLRYHALQFHVNFTGTRASGRSGTDLQVTSRADADDFQHVRKYFIAGKHRFWSVGAICPHSSDDPIAKQDEQSGCSRLRSGCGRSNDQLQRSLNRHSKEFGRFDVSNMGKSGLQ
jgi:hypothetical protein